jgi:hypothetical protein
MNLKFSLQLVEDLLSELWFECSEYGLHCTCRFLVALGTCLTSRVLCVMFRITLICYGEELFAY